MNPRSLIGAFDMMITNSITNSKLLILDDDQPLRYAGMVDNNLVVIKEIDVIDTCTGAISDYVVVLYEFDDSTNVYKELTWYAIESSAILVQCLKCLEMLESTVYYNAMQ